jgi:hypothetical protein
MLEPHLAEKTTKKNKKSDTLNSQPIQSFSMPHYAEKTGGLPCQQMLAPNLLGRCRPTGEQRNGMRYSYSYPWDKPAYPPVQTDPALQKQKQKLNNKQATEKEHAAEGVGCFECTGEGEKKLISCELSVNKDWKGRRANSGWVISCCLK